MESIEALAVSQIYADSNGDRFTALEDVSFAWTASESVAIMGESGSGKSTLARLMIGLEKPSSGEIRIDGENTAKWSDNTWRKHRTQLQAVFQDARGTLSPSRSVLQNAEEALCNLTTNTKQQRREQILSLMESMELKPELLKTPTSQLSGGEQRRVGLLRSLAVKPRFLVLDEVTAGLDLISAEAVLRVLAKYQEEADCSYLIVTHDLAVASRLCSKLYVFEHGHIAKMLVRE